MKRSLCILIGLLSFISLNGQSFNVEVGSGLSMSDGVLGYGIYAEPKYALTSSTAIGLELSYKDFKWLGDTGVKHKSNSIVFILQVKSASRAVAPYFSARLGYFNLYNLADHLESEYSTIGGGFNSGVYISIINIGMELNFYKENRPINGYGGVFLKIRF